MVRQSLLKLDWLMLLATLLLLGLGLLILFSITAGGAAAVADFNPWRQLAFTTGGLMVLVVVARLDFHLWRRLAWPLYALGIVLLIWVLVAGESVLGATRWIDLGWLQFQPSEFIKVGVILALAKLMAARYDDMGKLRYFGLSLLAVALPAVLIAVQPDLGSSIVVGFIWLVMILAASVNKWHLLGVIAVAAIILPLAIGGLAPYQRDRLQTFLDPAADPQGAGYNVAQATIAVGSGGLFGRGLTSGSQSQLNFIPSQHTDFVFAVLAEKLGFVGAAVALSLFVLLMVRVIVVARRTDDRFGFFLAVGTLGLLLSHVVINIGMNVQLLPVTGLPLPLMSFGGTNLLVTLFLISLLQSVSLHRRELAFKR